MTKIRWTQGERQGRTTEETESLESLIISPPSDTIWLNTCIRITFTWWMGWSEWRLGMDHQLILTANCEKYCTAHFVVEDLMLHQGQIFLHCSDVLYPFEKKDCFFYYCLMEIMFWCVCIACMYAAQWTVEAHLFGCFFIAAFNSYLSGSGTHI